MNYLAKEAPLQESIKNLSSVLEKIECKVNFNEEHSPLKSCYWLNLSYKDAPQYLYSNGKGSCKDAAIASALGEFVERLQTNNFFNDFYIQNNKHSIDEKLFSIEDSGYLSSNLLKIYNPNNELEFEDLIDFNSDHKEKIVALPFIEEFSKKCIYFPVAIVNNLYVSNGLAAGNTMLEAKVQALSEIIERYVKIEIIKNGYSLPAIPKEIIKSISGVNDGIDKLKTLGYKVEVLDASLGGKYPVVAISLVNLKNGTLFVSFGAHPQIEVAIERTFTELMQGRKVENLDNFELPTFDIENVNETYNIESHFIDSNGKIAIDFLSKKTSFNYCNFKYSGSTIEDEYNYLKSIIKNEKKELYVREYNYLGFNTCQIIVPDFSEIYPIEDLVYNNQNRGKFIRDDILNFENSNLNELLELVEDIDDSTDVGRYIGVIFKNQFTFAELKAQIYILLKEFDLAVDILNFAPQTTKNRAIKEILIAKIRSLDLNDFSSALNTLFGDKLVNLAVNIANGKEYLIDLEFSKEYLNILKLYTKLGSLKSAK